MTANLAINLSFNVPNLEIFSGIEFLKFLSRRFLFYKFLMIFGERTLNLPETPSELPNLKHSGILMQFCPGG
jgi:hypothetical protein